MNKPKVISITERTKVKTSLGVLIFSLGNIVGAFILATTMQDKLEAHERVITRVELKELPEIRLQQNEIAELKTDIVWIKKTLDRIDQRLR